jgi:DNA-binding transcriptional regulator YdaS (Cro superfamily)
MTYSDLVQHYGSQAAAARALGLAQPSIHEWQQTTIPYDRQCQIQIATGGRLLARKKDDARLIKKRAA